MRLTGANSDFLYRQISAVLIVTFFGSFRGLLSLSLGLWDSIASSTVGVYNCVEDRMV